MTVNYGIKSSDSTWWYRFTLFVYQNAVNLLIVSEEGGTMSFYKSDMRYLQQFLDRNFGAYV